MENIDLAEFEKRLRVRKLKSSDFEAVVALQRTCFPGMLPWTKEQFASMLERFPEGQLAVTVDKRLAASSASLILDFDMHSDWHDWRTIADSGFIRNHKPGGDTLYGIEIQVHPDFRGMKLARRLYEARKKVAEKHNLMRIVVGGRIPGYAKYKKELTAQEYVERVTRRELHDPVLTAQLANGFSLRSLIPEYMPSDEDSAGWATFLVWNNPHYVPDPSRRIEMVQALRVCSVQYEMRAVKGFSEFERQVQFFVDTASDYHCDFVVFPELFSTQLLSFTPAKRPGDAARKLAEFTKRYLTMFSKLAIKYNVNIVGGSQFAVEKRKLYNISYLFRRDGTIGKQYKIHTTPSERRWWGVEPGNSVEVFDTDKGKVAILICYDIEFPELVREAVKKGAQVIFCPFNTDDRHGYLRVRLCAQARCIENHIYVVTSGCVGNLPSVENADVHYAQSGIFTPSDIMFSRDGIAAECTPNIETVVMRDLDLELLRRHRYGGTTTNWNDRRKDLYRIAFKENGETIEI